MLLNCLRLLLRFVIILLLLFLDLFIIVTRFLFDMFSNVIQGTCNVQVLCMYDVQKFI